MKKIFQAFIFFVVSLAAYAQQDPSTQMGMAPYMTFQNGDVDHVNTGNGNVYIQIPLLSYPQKGNKLRMNFFIRYNHPQWQVNITSDPSVVGEGDYVGQWTYTDMFDQAPM